MALQAAEMGVIVHGVAGFSEERIRANLNVPDNFSIEAMAAIGYPGEPERLDSKLRQAEIPSHRKPLFHIVGQGKFRFKE